MFWKLALLTSSGDYHHTGSSVITFLYISGNSYNQTWKILNINLLCQTLDRCYCPYIQIMRYHNAKMTTKKHVILWDLSLFRVWPEPIICHLSTLLLF